MITISNLAKKYSISRTTILYYEKENLLLPTNRSSNGYRWYNSSAQDRLEKILAYRRFGLSIVEIADLLNDKDAQTQELKLKEQFFKIEEQKKELAQQQKAILGLLNQPEVHCGQRIKRDKWVEVMKAAGLSDKDLVKWHQQFEDLDPQSHHEFLETLDFNQEEILSIRKKYQK